MWKRQDVEVREPIGVPGTLDHVAGKVSGLHIGPRVLTVEVNRHDVVNRSVQGLPDGAANLIVIASEETISEITEAATSRGRRIVMLFTDADVDLLERELQRAMTMGEPQAM